jgi:hypothetical protein
MTADRSKPLLAPGNIVEDGLYHPPHQGAAPALRANGFRHIPVAGLGSPVQFFRVRLVDPTSGATSEQLVISAHHPPMPDAVVREVSALRVHAPGVALAFTLEDRVGWARAVADTPAAGAAAIAIVKASASWDESDPIAVDVAGVSFDVRARHDGEAWVVDVRERAR